MNKRMLFGLVLITTSVAKAVLDYRTIVKEERLKRDEIASKLETDLDAIKIASLKMEARLKDPSYRPTGVQQVFDDLYFEIIAAHEE